MKKNHGFTLIELMIVVAIIAIIAAIAIPNMLRSRMSANEAGAAGATRTLSTSEVQFQSAGIILDANGVGMYGALSDLGATTPPFIDSTLAGGTKSGYNFVLDSTGGARAAVGAPAFECLTTPINTSTGVRRFFVDESGVITFTSDGTDPNSDSPPLN